MLKLGSQGSAVRAAQITLAADLGITLQPDGIFGPSTREAVKSFQIKYGLEPDGIIGPATQARFRVAVTVPVEGLQMVQESPAFPPSNYGTRRGAPPSMIVVHHSDTTNALATKRALTWRGFSTHYEVDRDGTIYEYLDPAKFVAWHAGGNTNHRSIGIDFTHHGDQEFTAAQLKAGHALIAYLCGLFNIPAVVPEDKLFPRDDHNRAQLPAGVGVFRHRNIALTACPADLPLEDVVAGRV